MYTMLFGFTLEAQSNHAVFNLSTFSHSSPFFPIILSPFQFQMSNVNKNNCPKSKSFTIPSQIPFPIANLNTYCFTYFFHLTPALTHLVSLFHFTLTPPFFIIAISSVQISPPRPPLLHFCTDCEMEKRQS